MLCMAAKSCETCLTESAWDFQVPLRSISQFCFLRSSILEKWSMVLREKYLTRKLRKGCRNSVSEKRVSTEEGVYCFQMGINASISSWTREQQQSFLLELELNCFSNSAAGRGGLTASIFCLQCASTRQGSNSTTPLTKSSQVWRCMCQKFLTRYSPKRQTSSAYLWTFSAKAIVHTKASMPLQGLCLVRSDRWKCSSRMVLLVSNMRSRLACRMLLFLTLTDLELRTIYKLRVKVSFLARTSAPVVPILRSRSMTSQKCIWMSCASIMQSWGMFKLQVNSCERRWFMILTNSFCSTQSQYFRLDGSQYREVIQSNFKASRKFQLRYNCQNFRRASTLQAQRRGAKYVLQLRSVRLVSATCQLSFSSSMR